MVTNSPELRAATSAAPDELASLIAELEVVVPRYAQTLRRVIEEREGRDSLTLPQYRCLQAVAARESTLTTHLARRFQVGVPTMTGRLDALVERGLIQRQPDPASRRQVLVTITAQGQELLGRYQKLVDAELRELLAPLAPERQVRLRDALGDLAAALATAQDRTNQPPCGRE
ncbi:MAG: MarR family transcriptional regulator [Thermomicrobiales bacterium]